MIRFTALAAFAFTILMMPARAQDVPTPAAFVEQAGLSHQFAVDSAKAGLENFGTQEVRSAAMRVMKDYIVPFGQLKAAAVRAGLPAPYLLNEPYGERLRTLLSKKGPEFDALFISELMAETDKEITLFLIYAEKGEPADLKAYAEKMLPVLKQHLELLQMLEKR